MELIELNIDDCRLRLEQLKVIAYLKKKGLQLESFNMLLSSQSDYMYSFFIDSVIGELFETRAFYTNGSIILSSEEQEIMNERITFFSSINIDPDSDAFNGVKNIARYNKWSAETNIIAIKFSMEELNSTLESDFLRFSNTLNSYYEEVSMAEYNDCNCKIYFFGYSHTNPYFEVVKESYEFLEKHSLIYRRVL